MITAIVNFKLPAEIDARKAADLFKSSAPKYRAMKGLVGKYYLFDDHNRVGGGVYLWKSRATPMRSTRRNGRPTSPSATARRRTFRLLRDFGRGRQRERQDPG